MRDPSVRVVILDADGEKLAHVLTVDLENLPGAATLGRVVAGMLKDVRRDRVYETLTSNSDLLFLARLWLIDCDWDEWVDEEAKAKEIATLPARTIARAVHRYYEGGIPQFIRNTQVTP